MHEREKWKWSRSVVSDSQRPHGLQPTRLLYPWGFPGKSTRVGCHCLLQYKHYYIENRLLIRTYYIAQGTQYSIMTYKGAEPKTVAICITDTAESKSTMKSKSKSTMKVRWKWRSLNRVWLFATPWTAAYQAPLSMGFSKQEYWSGVPLPSPRVAPGGNHSLMSLDCSCPWIE